MVAPYFAIFNGLNIGQYNELIKFFHIMLELRGRRNPKSGRTAEKRSFSVVPWNDVRHISQSTINSFAPTAV